MPEIESRVVAWTVGPSDVPCYDTSITHVKLVDESGGEFVEVRQLSDYSEGTIRLEAKEWPTLRAVLDKAFKSCRDL